MIIETRDRSDVPIEKLRTAFESLENEPTLDPVLLDLLRWSADYYRHPLGEVISAALPVALRNGTRIADDSFSWRVTEVGRGEAFEKLPVRATALRCALQAVLAADLDKDALARDVSRESLKKLEQRGYVEKVFVQKTSLPPIQRDAGPELNEAQ